MEFIAIVVDLSTMKIPGTLDRTIYLTTVISHRKHNISDTKMLFPDKCFEKVERKHFLRRIFAFIRDFPHHG